MEFNTWNSDPFKPVAKTTGVADVLNFLSLILNTIIIITVLAQMVDWCQDPVAENLRNKVEELELENENLTNQVDDLNARMDHLNESLRNAIQISQTNSGAESEDETMDNTVNDTQG